MKQVIQDIRSGETAVIEIPVPKPKPGMALVRSAASLLSAGTERMIVEFGGKSLLGKAISRPDLVRRTVDKARREGLLTAFEAVQSRLEQPMPLGYSSAGTIVDLGEGVTGFSVGDRVACAGGGYAVHAEYALIPRRLMAKLPDGVEFESAAFATLGAIALHGFRLAEPQLGERVAVIGLGVLGQLATGVARAAGSRVFGMDLHARRVEVARRMGVEAVIRKEAEAAGAAFSHGAGFDVVLVCADNPSNDPIELAGEIARDRGRIVVIGAVGMEIPRRLFYQKELTLLVARSYGPGRYDPNYEEAGFDYPLGYVRWTEGRNLEAFVALLAAGQVDPRPLITHRFPIEGAPEAYRVIQSRAQEPHLAVLVTYPEPEKEEARPRIDLSRRVVAESAPIRLGVLGAGSFARTVLLPILRKLRGIELVGVSAPSGLSSAQAGRRYGFRYATSDEDQILNDHGINTIAVLTRHHLHARQTAAALRAGKHVFCEKPLAVNRSQLDEVLEALESSDGLLTVGFNRRFSPLMRQLKGFMAPVQEPVVMNYRVNALQLAAGHWLHDPEQGGGRIIGEACHFIDCLTFLAGALPTRISAHGVLGNERYHEDNVVLTIEFTNGSLGTIAYLANGDRALPKERLETFGGQRTAVMDDFRRLETLVEGRRRVRRAWLRQDKGHRAEWEAFAESLATGGAAPIPYQELLAVSLASFAAVEALRSGETVVVESIPVKA